ncbi:hypothetical protein [Modestobacter sp. SYSU DS0511]
MSRLNHDRPVLRVIDAGGGERIRTIAEDLRAAQRADRMRHRQLRCTSCGTTKKVVLPYRACRGCLADTRTITQGKKKLRSLGGAGAAASSAAAGRCQASIAAAEARIAQRKRTNSGRSPQATPRSGSQKTASPRPNLRAAERAAEAARKELLLARTDWERDLLRGRLKKAQEALATAQRLDRQRRALM